MYFLTVHQQKIYCLLPSAAESDNQKIIIISVTTSVAAVALILLIAVGAILIKTRRYKRYLQLQFEQVSTSEIICILGRACSFTSS